jgi:hypothetical protein
LEELLEEYGGVIGNKMDKQARQIDEAIQELEVKRVGGYSISS